MFCAPECITELGEDCPDLTRGTVMRTFRCIASLMVLVLLFSVPVLAGKFSLEKITKQVGGTSGDSCIVAADTSSWVLLERTLTRLFVIAMADSDMAYTVQVATDTTHWMQVDIDTVSAGTAEATADFGSIYRDFNIRIITDNLTAAGAAFGTAAISKDW